MLFVIENDGEAGVGGAQGIETFIQSGEERVRVGFGAEVDDELAAFDRLVESHAGHGPGVASDELDGGEFTGKGAVGTEGHLEMSNLGFRREQSGLKITDEVKDEGVGVEFFIRRDDHRGVEPTKQGFAIGTS